MKATITSSTEISSLFQTAEKSVQRNLIVFLAAEEHERNVSGRVAYVVGKKLGSAPFRSRAKRMLREAARLEGAPWSEKRCLLVARSGIEKSSLNELRRQLSLGLRRLGYPDYEGPDPQRKRQAESQTGSNVSMPGGVNSLEKTGIRPGSQRRREKLR